MQDAFCRGEGLRSEAGALHFRKPHCFGETLERRLCIKKREDAGRFGPGFPYGLP